MVLVDATCVFSLVLKHIVLLAAALPWSKCCWLGPGARVPCPGASATAACVPYPSSTKCPAVIPMDGDAAVGAPVEGDDRLALPVNAAPATPPGGYTTAAELWADIMDFMQDDHPVNWIRLLPSRNYHELLLALLRPAGGWHTPVPDEAFSADNKRGLMMEVPISVVAFQETVDMGGVFMDTCWKTVSKVRVLDVMHRCLMGGKGLETDAEVPTLVTSTAWAGQGLQVGDLKLCCPHGTMTTRLMGAHCVLRATMIMAGQRNPWELPEVKALVDSLSRMRVTFKVISNEERTVLALGLALNCT